MKENIKRLHGKKGVTLVELIVVMAITAIIFGVAIAFLQPVTALMNSLKGNAHMDTMCDTVNEYIRSSLHTATSISVFTYPDSGTSIADDADAMDDQYNEYKKKVDEGFTIKALAVLRNDNDDYRLYDFGNVSDLSKFEWGKNSPKFTVNSFSNLIDNRDGGDPAAGGLDFNEFHKFDAFNEDFYANGSNDKELNYSLQMCFDYSNKEIQDEEGNTIDGVQYLTMKSQVFKRTGRNYYDPDDGTVHHNASFEPVNQLKSISFNLLNGKASFDSSKKINKTVIDGGAEMIDTSDGMSGVIILYLVKNF